MPSIFSSLDEALKTILHSRNIISKTPVMGGDINKSFKLELDNGSTLFIKENDLEAYPDMFEKEARGLMAIRDNEGPKVPKVFGVVKDDPRQTHKRSPKQYLLLEYIPPPKPIPKGSLSTSYWETLGISLAKLHNANSKKVLTGQGHTSFGFPQNNYIGSTPQINSPLDNWVLFFKEHRLEYQIKLARNKNLFSKADTQQARQFLDRLDELLIPPTSPELVHGDLWSGNIHIDHKGNPVLIDPAVYYGHGEVDLAMTELFGGFQDTFYRAYKNIKALSPGYEIRKEIYNVYHLLNHLNIFGLSYHRQSLSIIHKYL